MTDTTKPKRTRATKATPMSIALACIEQISRLGPDGRAEALRTINAVHGDDARITERVERCETLLGGKADVGAIGDVERELAVAIARLATRVTALEDKVPQ